MTEPNRNPETRRRGARSLLIASLVALAVVAHADVNEEAIGKVKAGELTEARASWWGFDPVDSTEALQSAIDSGAARVIVEDMGTPWIVTPIKAASNQEIVFEKGVVVEAKRGEFKGRKDSLFSIRLKENVSLIGYGATLRMWREDYDAPPYERAEWRHVVDIGSSSNVNIFGLTLAESGGDGIYVGAAKRGVATKNVHIKDVVCDRNYRQGISVITVENLLIENTVMKNTAGARPEAGIDFEPNYADEKIVNVVMRNCVSENNRGIGYLFSLQLDGGADPVSVRMENCVARGSNRFALHFGTVDGGARGPVTGFAEFINCTFTDGRGPAISINKPASGLNLIFENCRIANVPEGNDINPIAFTARRDDTAQPGGVVFNDCILEDAVQRPVARYDDWTPGGLRLIDVTGALTVRRNGKETIHTFTQEWLDTRSAGSRYKRFPRYETAGVEFEPLSGDLAPEKLALRPFSLRPSGTFILYANSGDDVTFELRHVQVGNYRGSAMKVAARTPSGKEIELGKARFQKSATFSFKAPETGVYRIPVDAGNNLVQMVSANRPACVSGERRFLIPSARGAINFIKVTGDFYFYVPEGTQEFGVRVFAYQREPVDAAIYDPAGKKVWEKSAIMLPTQFIAEPKEHQTGKAWKVVFANPLDDFSIELQGIPPFLSCNPDTLLRPTE